jgi:hypothetical protein
MSFRRGFHCQRLPRDGLLRRKHENRIATWATTCIGPGGVAIGVLPPVARHRIHDFGPDHPRSRLDSPSSCAEDER